MEKYYKLLRRRITRLFKDDGGKIVIVQKPNLPLFFALGFYLLRFIPVSAFDEVSSWGVTVVMLHWSFLEITSGVNAWRRIFGVLTGIYFLNSLYFLVF